MYQLVCYSGIKYPECYTRRYIGDLEKYFTTVNAHECILLAKCRHPLVEYPAWYADKFIFHTLT